MQDVIIIGGGPAGMTAGIYAVREGLSTLILEGKMIGGQIAETATIENYPGFPEGITGSELAERMEKQAKKQGAKIEMLDVTRIEKESGHFKVITKRKSLECKTVILATGAKHRQLLVPGEERFRNRGVSYCITCDGPLFRGRRVGVVGGGDSAAEAAIYFDKIAKEVYLIHRRNELRANIALQKKLDQSKVEIIWDTIVKEMKGEKLLEEVVLYNKKTKEESTLKLDGIFIEIGETPTAMLAKELGVTSDKRGFIIVDKGMRTDVPGIFACGDITNGVLQITSAVGEGTIAAMSAHEYIKNLK